MEIPMERLAAVKRPGFFKRLATQGQLTWMSVPIVLYVILFTYVPLAGWTIAFQDFKPFKSFAQQKWVGLKWFLFLFQDEKFVMTMRNTLAMSLINLTLGFVCA